MWRPELNSLVYIRHPDADIARTLADYIRGHRPNLLPEKKFRVELLVDYPDGGVEAILQPEHENYPPGESHTIYTSWLTPAQ
jgi:hypothetical protein